ncbi:MAG: hypothetical protein HYV19_03285 [Gemmatimonadetes bacterium]|nr:hypothetical protein [Gemmatimonadota bacterium]
MRALSTLTLALIATGTAAAQSTRGAPFDDGSRAWHAALEAGSMRGLTVSDRASNSAWVLSSSHPISASIGWGGARRIYAVRLQHVAAPLDLQGGVCTGCDGTVRATSVMATLRSAAPLFDSGLRQMVELGIGTTTWHSLTGRNGQQPPSIDPTTDFTYSAAIGIGLPVSERFEFVTMYDIMMARHQQKPRASGAANPAFVGLSILRVALRARLSQ